MTQKAYPQKCTEDDFVFFLHIPKTAGTSIAASLSPLFPEEHILTHYQMNNVRKHPREVFLNARFLHGHFTWEVYGKRLPKQPDFILTFLRDPVEHFVSTFFHLKIDPTFTYTTRLCEDKALAIEIHEFVKERSIEEFLDYKHSRLFDNFQTRYLVRGLSDSHSELGDGELLPIAERLLLNLPFFGLTERMQESMNLLASTLHTRNRLKIGQANRSRNKPGSYSLDDSARREIEKRTVSDRRLYALADGALTDRVTACDDRTEQ